MAQFIPFKPVRFQTDRLTPEPQIGAWEITSFDGAAINDNHCGHVRPDPHMPARMAVPAAAFVSGLTAALLIAGIGELFGLVG